MALGTHGQTSPWRAQGHPKKPQGAPGAQTDQFAKCERNVRLRSQAPKTVFGGLGLATRMERPKLTTVLQFGQGAARKIAQFYNSVKVNNGIATQFCNSDKGHPRRRPQFCKSEKLKFAHGQIS